MFPQCPCEDKTCSNAVADFKITLYCTYFFCQVAKDSSVEKLIDKIGNWYFEKEGN